MPSPTQETTLCADDGLQVTEEQAEAIHYDGDETYHIMAEAMPQIVWSANTDGSRNYFNQRWAEHTHMSAAKTKGWGWLAALHPDDALRCRQAWTEAAQNRGTYECEYRLLCVDGGDYCWHIERALPVFDPQGRIIKWFGTCTDIDALKDAQAEIEALNQVMDGLNVQLQALADTDGLTGLKNHRAFQERLREEVQRAARHATPLSLLMVDVDEFKSYNDAFGHPAGDAALCRIGEVLQRATRTHDLIARYGGEEFAVILPEMDAEHALLAAERFRAAIEATDWRKRQITVSLGAATLSPTVYDSASLISQADEALYRSKARGRNRVIHSRATAPDGNVDAERA